MISAGGGEAGLIQREASVGGNSESKKEVAPERLQLSIAHLTYSVHTYSQANSEVNPTFIMGLNKNKYIKQKNNI
jgi:hypothetical protein